MEILDLLKNAVAEGTPVALCTVVNTKGAVPRHAGTKMIVYRDGSTDGTVGGGELENLVHKEALAAIKDGKTRFLNYDLINVEKGDPGLCGGSVSIFVEPYLHPATVVVVGAGHVGRAVAHLASWLGFRVVISDDRKELCTPERSPGGDVYLPVSMADLPDEMTIDSQTYMVLVTRCVDVDLAGLPSILKTDTPYIGLIGSNHRWSHTKEKLLEIGISQEDIGRIKSPIGIDINAETPEEIAVSIMAEIINWRNEDKRHLRK
ncbi:MAG: XdhC family protein [Brevefilum sp.]|nr:XdhC family protein [Brevefilum sp.]